ncbi:unnamed protein product [Tilletia controversa]|uniref:Uncharacterized protein n=1 Tax=Tilletia controversa TaxID=13291 RepID=A0A8X7SYD2_9BASI|nr:hypothetical protein CF328_g1025 [Tilletia controversa]CAD6896772.1 unnamed protein product [Tilletia laevis]KAE8251959.1 hypothetical protein A4X06_0g2475 [Tilletia controversa]CAD6926204.1 unnamed protein product [Tilletia controversa]CAD6963310.1 unnamed protein product [Tilletia controversa]
MAFRMLAGQEAVAGARKCPWLLTAVNTLSQFLQDTGEGGAELRNVAPYVGQLPDEKGKLEVGRRSVALDFIGFNAEMYELKVAERRLIREHLCAEFMPDLLQTLERNGLPSDHPDLLKMVRDNVEKELDDRYLTKLGPGVRVYFDEGEGDDSKRPIEGDPIKFITKQLREAATI